MMEASFGQFTVNQTDFRNEIHVDIIYAFSSPSTGMACIYFVTNKNILLFKPSIQYVRYYQ